MYCSQWNYQTFLEERGLPTSRLGENPVSVARFTLGAADTFPARFLALNPVARLAALLLQVLRTRRTPALGRTLSL